MDTEETESDAPADGAVPGAPAVQSAAEGDAGPGFEAMGLAPELLQGVIDAGFVAPRPIQTAVLPAGLAGGDILGLARTGTGKTAAFALPILQRLRGAMPAAEGAPAPRALILAPTRELAQQIKGDCARLGARTGLRVAAVYGGVAPKRQLAEMEGGVDVVVATTGRLLDLVRSGELLFDRVEVLVLDEADRLFAMGFLPDLRTILGRLPAERQTMMFSATMPEEIQALAQRILIEPTIVDLGRSAPPATIDHALYPVRTSAKLKVLDAILALDESASAIVFVRTKQRAKELSFRLRKRGHSFVILHGDRKQGARSQALEDFSKGAVRILLATDLASRGLDVENVGLVLNYDVPLDPDAYVHRIGRTGRAEKKGQAFTIAVPGEGELVRAIEGRLRARLERRYLESFVPMDLVELEEEEADRVKSRSGTRPSKKKGGSKGKRGGSKGRRR